MTLSVVLLTMVVTFGLQENTQWRKRSYGRQLVGYKCLLSKNQIYNELIPVSEELMKEPFFVNRNTNLGPTTLIQFCEVGFHFKYFSSTFAELSSLVFYTFYFYSMNCCQNIFKKLLCLPLLMVYFFSIALRRKSVIFDNENSDYLRNIKAKALGQQNLNKR